MFVTGDVENRPTLATSFKCLSLRLCDTFLYFSIGSFLFFKVQLHQSTTFFCFLLHIVHSIQNCHYYCLCFDSFFFVFFTPPIFLLQNFFDSINFNEDTYQIGGNWLSNCKRKKNHKTTIARMFQRQCVCV